MAAPTEPEVSESKTKRWHLPRWSGTTWAVVSVLATVIGTIIGAVYTNAVRDHREISWCVLSGPTKVVDSAAANEAIILSDASGNRVVNDVYSTEVVIWNSGNVPLRKDPQVPAESIDLRFPGRGGLLDARIVDRTDPKNAAGWKLMSIPLDHEESKTSKEQARDPGTRLDWHLMDMGFAVKVRMLSTSIVTPRFEVNGYVVGCDGFVRRDRSDAVSRGKRIMKYSSQAFRAGG